MSEPNLNGELALDQPGSAGPYTLRRSIFMAGIIVAMAIIVVWFGDVQLQEYPQFTTFHAGFVFLVDTMIAVILLGQFVYRRLPAYCILATAYLVSALLTVPFLLSFPGALKAQGQIIGSSQSAIWIWHIWHIMFPSMVALALLVHRHATTVANEHVTRFVYGAVLSGIAITMMASIAITLFHDYLPVLITHGPEPLTTAFYVTGGIAALVTGFALVQALYIGRRKSLLFVWLAIALIAFLADITASLGAYSRYTVGWYFGRVESMAASAVLLFVFFGEINRLYRRLTYTMDEVFSKNRQLASMVEEKEALVVELQRREEEIRQLAYYDPVTELANRRLLMDRLNYSQTQAKRYNHSTALLFLDLDEFKGINDRFGHEVGDRLLRDVAARLNHCVRSGDLVARIGGDEFVILLPEISQARDAVAVAEKINKNLQLPMICGGHPLSATASIGVAISTPTVFRGAEELLAQADSAMYVAKKEGRNRIYLDVLDSKTATV